MDLINDITKRDNEERDSRLLSFDESKLVMAHNGELPVIEGFEVARAKTLLDFFKLPNNVIVAIGDDSSALAETLARDLEVTGLNISQLVDVPGQVAAYEVSKWLAPFRSLSLTSILTDIADQRMIKDSLSETELELSQAKKQHSQRARKNGLILPLLDFDHVAGAKANDSELDQVTDL